jgi:hypothetical protein
MRLEPEHPSFAHFTFVAAIERYGIRLADDGARFSRGAV